ncbi:MAG: VIT and VWA domain-containing protein [Planctomycetota bacterium]|nr:VIT and VWA domain-containing protein [Planctomycetota bacterium]
MSEKHIARRLLAAGVVFSAVAFVSAEPARGQGLIVTKHRHDFVSPPRFHPRRPHHRPPSLHRPIYNWSPFSIKSQRVDVEINDAVAETTLEQVFVNRSRRPAEGKYLFSIATDAAVHNLTMWMNGREISGELLDADKARQIYESIVSKMRDPALLEFTGRGLIQANVFPIPAGGECRIKLQYSEPVRGDGGPASYRFPLRGGSSTYRPIEKISLRVAIRTKRPLTSVYCPTHVCSVDRRGPNEAVVGFEQSGVQLQDDFQLYFERGDDEFGLSLLTHRGWGDEGFFMARIAPRQAGVGGAVLPKNICFVLDTSGSMADNNKIAQARRALNFCIQNLGDEDRFNVVTFATEVRVFREMSWKKADNSNKQAAREFIDGLKAIGGTDINAALQRALEMNPGRMPVRRGNPVRERWTDNPYFVVFITDGEPTVGVTDVPQILKNVTGLNPDAAARIFVLGVGFKVNTKLLDSLANDNGGARGYVTPSEDLELKLSAFYTKLANPVLTRLALAFQGISIHDVYPRKLPDLFKGSELVVMGRYSGSSDGAIVELKGTRRGEPAMYRYPASFPSMARGSEFLPRLWATQKIGYLLDELRLHGENREVKTEVIRLSKKYGIMTPFTSFLVQEDERIARREGRRPVTGRFLPKPAARAIGARDQEIGRARNGFKSDSGSDAVASSRDVNRLKRMGQKGGTAKLKYEVQDFLQTSEGERAVQFVGKKTFYLDGVRWVDADYDDDREPIRLVAFSEAYFQFLREHPGAGQTLAQGGNVLFEWDGKIYEIVPPESKEAP